MTVLYQQMHVRTLKQYSDNAFGILGEKCARVSDNTPTIPSEYLKKNVRACVNLSHESAVDCHIVS